MSVLIKGMDMPTETYSHCMLVKGINGAVQLHVYAKNSEDTYEWEYYDLVPVPPHGRLIDADALLNDKGVGTQISGWGKMYHETAIEYAPTSLDAEEGE